MDAQLPHLQHGMAAEVCHHSKPCVTRSALRRDPRRRSTSRRSAWRETRWTAWAPCCLTPTALPPTDRVPYALFPLFSPACTHLPSAAVPCCKPNMECSLGQMCFALSSHASYSSVCQTVSHCSILPFLPALLLAASCLVYARIYIASSCRPYPYHTAMRHITLSSQFRAALVYCSNVMHLPTQSRPPTSSLASAALTCPDWGPRRMALSVESLPLQQANLGSAQGCQAAWTSCSAMSQLRVRFQDISMPRQNHLLTASPRRHTAAAAHAAAVRRGGVPGAGAVPHRLAPRPHPDRRLPGPGSRRHRRRLSARPGPPPCRSLEPGEACRMRAAGASWSSRCCVLARHQIEHLAAAEPHLCAQQSIAFLQAKLLCVVVLLSFRVAARLLPLCNWRRRLMFHLRKNTTDQPECACVSCERGLQQEGRVIEGKETERVNWDVCASRGNSFATAFRPTLSTCVGAAGVFSVEWLLRSWYNNLYSTLCTMYARPNHFSLRYLMLLNDIRSPC